MPERSSVHTYIGGWKKVRYMLIFWHKLKNFSFDICCYPIELIVFLLNQTLNRAKKIKYKSAQRTQSIAVDLLQIGCIIWPISSNQFSFFLHQFSQLPHQVVCHASRYEKKSMNLTVLIENLLIDDNNREKPLFGPLN